MSGRRESQELELPWRRLVHEPLPIGCMAAVGPGLPLAFNALLNLVHLWSGLGFDWVGSRFGVSGSLRIKVHGKRGGLR